MYPYMCPNCGMKFHSSSESKENEPCEVCGNSTTKIVDDAESTIVKARLIVDKARRCDLSSDLSAGQIGEIRRCVTSNYCKRECKFHIRFLPIDPDGDTGSIIDSVCVEPSDYKLV